MTFCCVPDALFLLFFHFSRRSFYLLCRQVANALDRPPISTTLPLLLGCFFLSRASCNPIDDRARYHHVSSQISGVLLIANGHDSLARIRINKTAVDPTR